VSQKFGVIKMDTLFQWVLDGIKKLFVWLWGQVQGLISSYWLWIIALGSALLGPLEFMITTASGLLDHALIRASGLESYIQALDVDSFNANLVVAGHALAIANHTAPVGYALVVGTIVLTVVTVAAAIRLVLRIISIIPGVNIG
jgi:hypothetical protein